MNLAGRTALVCGASRGIGAATAMLLAEQGARVVVLARNQNSLAELIETMPPAHSGAHEIFCADLANFAELGGALDTLLHKLSGPISILVNNSSGPKGGPLVSATCEEFFTAQHQHLMAAHTLVQKLIPGMKAQKYGRIINVLSTSVRIPIAGLGVSNVTRSAMAAWAKTLANELAPLGITVNNVLPGYTSTERLEELVNSRASTLGVSASEVKEQWRQQVPMQRFATAKEVGGAVCFFASELASYITGQNLAVDGGRIGAI